jgi:hypothetical protein
MEVKRKSKRKSKQARCKIQSKSSFVKFFVGYSLTLHSMPQFSPVRSKKFRKEYNGVEFFKSRIMKQWVVDD